MQTLEVSKTNSVSAITVITRLISGRHVEGYASWNNSLACFGNTSYFKAPLSEWNSADV